MQLSHGICLVNHTRVVVVHAVDVGPYLYFICVQGCTDQRGGIVAATAQQVVNFAIGISADETLGDIHLVSLVLLHLLAQFLSDIGSIRLTVFVGTHKVECREQHGLVALFLQIVGHHVGAHDFALCHNALLLETGEQVFGERAQIFKLVLQESPCLILPLCGGEELVHMFHIDFFQTVDDLVGAIGVFLI